MDIDVRKEEKKKVTSAVDIEEEKVAFQTITLKSTSIESGLNLDHMKNPI